MLVDRLIVENGRAVGVRFMQGGEVVEARTKGEVILCAGSIGSTQVLHRSGIGPADWLSPLGIDVALDKPGVGRNLQDHLQQRAIYKVVGVRTLNETYYNLIRRGMMGLDYAFRRRGPLTMAPSQLGIFTRSDPRRERANIQFHVQPLSLDKFGDPLHRFPAITVSACNLQPTSRGTVRIRSAKPDEAPSIAPNYLSTDDDRQVAADAIRTTRRLMKQKRLERYHPQEYLPGPSVGDDDASLAKAAGDIGTTIFHPVGTAKMGTSSDPLAVVDERLRFSWARRLARRRRFGDADDHVGQHQHADGDDRGERCRDDFGGWTPLAGPPLTLLHPAIMPRRDRPLSQPRRGHGLVVIGVGVVIGIGLIERPVCPPAGEHVGIGMIESIGPGFLDRGLREHGRCDRGHQKRGGERRDRLGHW